MNKEFEKLDALIAGVQRRKQKASVPSPPNRNCIREEVLEDYLDHKSPPDMIKKLETHLADCTICFDRMMILRAMRSEKNLTVPQKFLDRARDLIQESRPNCLELVLGFAKDTIRIIRTTGTLLSPLPVLEPVRGDSQEELGNKTDYIEVKKPFGDITVNAQIERVDGSYKLMINTLDTQTRLAPANMRLILSSLGRELNSVDDSEAVFYIKLKKYIIKILQEDREIGTISLDLRREE
jgi:hypothetical protein